MDDEERPHPDPLAPYPTLAERDAGQLPEPELYEDVPPHLEIHLRDWVSRALQDQEGFARTVVVRCRISWTARVEVTRGVYQRLNSQAVLNHLVSGRSKDITTARPLDRLSIVDAIINLHPNWDAEDPLGGWSDHDPQREWRNLLVDLNTLLRDCGSAWYVDEEFRGLYRRVDPTATEAWRRAREAAGDAGRSLASRYLAQAWQEIYGQHPDPSAGYAAAVKAVEAAALPVVFPDRKAKGKRPTVHQARTELDKHGSRWRFVLAESDQVVPGDGSVEVVASMLDRLLKGETERHADDDNRPSEKDEAAAAVHLAVLLVQWFVTDAIRPLG